MNLNNEDNAVVTCIVEATKLNLSGLRMKCPHCLTKIFYGPEVRPFSKNGDEEWEIISGDCPECDEKIIYLERFVRGKKLLSTLVYPKSVARSPLSPDVPEEFAKDYKEACLVLSESRKASAALSRRCLQCLLREKVGVKKGDLFNEIGEVLASKQLPSYLAEGIDAVRAIGNFAAHPMKSTNTGAIAEVEDGEAEWLLDILEGLFDFYFVQPALLQRKKDALNQKMIDLGKSPIQ
jgi:hypothetical protein